MAVVSVFMLFFFSIVDCILKTIEDYRCGVQRFFQRYEVSKTLLL